MRFWGTQQLPMSITDLGMTGRSGFSSCLLVFVSDYLNLSWYGSFAFIMYKNVIKTKWGPNQHRHPCTHAMRGSVGAIMEVMIDHGPSLLPGKINSGHAGRSTRGILLVWAQNPHDMIIYWSRVFLHYPLILKMNKICCKIMQHFHATVAQTHGKWVLKCNMIMIDYRSAWIWLELYLCLVIPIKGMTLSRATFQSKDWGKCDPARTQEETRNNGGQHWGQAHTGGLSSLGTRIIRTTASFLRTWSSIQILPWTPVRLAGKELETGLDGVTMKLVSGDQERVRLFWKSSHTEFIRAATTDYVI